MGTEGAILLRTLLASQAHGSHVMSDSHVVLCCVTSSLHVLFPEGYPRKPSSCFHILLFFFSASLVLSDVSLSSPRGSRSTEIFWQEAPSTPPAVGPTSRQATSKPAF